MKLSQVPFQAVTQLFRNAAHCLTDLVSWHRLCKGKDAREFGEGKIGKCACLFNKKKGGGGEKNKPHAKKSSNYVCR